MMELPHSMNGSGPAADRGWTARLVLSTIFLAMVLEALALGAVMVSMGLPSILGEFPTTQGGWLTTVYFLVGAVCAPLLGKAADLYGKRRVLLVAMLVSGVGALVCALAPSFAVLVAGRALQGPILATISLIPSFIRDVYPPRQAAFAASITITGMGAFSLISPQLIGWLIETGGFRGMFWFDMVWTFALCVAIRLTMPESTLRRKVRPDVLGGALLAAGVLAVLLYVSMGGTWGWVSAIPLPLGGAVLLALFFLHTRRTPEPIVNLSLFRRKTLVFVAIAGATAYGVSAATFQIVPLIAMTPRELGITYGLGFSTLEYSSLESPKALATVLAGLVLGFLVARGRNPRLFLILGLVAWAIGMALLAFRNDTFTDLLLGALIVGVANGLANASVPGLVMRATPPGDQGSTAGTVQLCQTGFSAVLPTVMFAVLASYATFTPGGGVVYAEQGFRTWLLISTALVVVVLLIGVTLLRERRGEAVEEFTVDARQPAAVSAGDGTTSPPVDAPKI